MSPPSLIKETPHVTVTVHRAGVGGSIALTVVLEPTPHEEWVVTTALNEEGDEVELNSNEDLLARCFAKAGVDETGR